MKKIVIITQYYKPEMGAPQNRLFEMAVGLKKCGWDISVLTAMPNYPKGEIFNKYKGKFFSKEILDGINIRRYWLYASNSKKVFPRIISMLSFSFSILFSAYYLRKNRFDIVIVESPPLTLGFSGWLLSKFSKSKFVFNVSDLWPLSAKELGVISDGFAYSLLEKLESFLYKKSSLCLGQSSEIVNYIKDHDAKSVYLFRNGVNPMRFLDFDVQRKSNTLVYAGLLGVAQGIYELCKNVDFSELNIEFHIYGDGSEKDILVNYLNDNPNRNIFYHGSVSSNEIPRILKSHSASLILLVKNIFGAVPSKIYEAMAAGLPIFFSGEGEAVSIIEDNRLGWVSSPRNYEQLKVNISNAFTNPNEFHKKVINCQNAATNLFDRTKQIQSLSDVLKALI